MKRTAPESCGAPAADRPPACATDTPSAPAVQPFPDETPLRVYCLRCGKSYASNDGVRKHSKRYHPQWMAQMDAQREPVSGPSPPPMGTDSQAADPAKRPRTALPAEEACRSQCPGNSFATSVVTGAAPLRLADVPPPERPGPPTMIDPNASMPQGFWMRVLPPVKRGPSLMNQGDGAAVPSGCGATATAGTASFAPVMPYAMSPLMPIMPMHGAFGMGGVVGPMGPGGASPVQGSVVGSGSRGSHDLSTPGLQVTKVHAVPIAPQPAVTANATVAGNTTANAIPAPPPSASAGTSPPSAALAAVQQPAPPLGHVAQGVAMGSPAPATGPGAGNPPEITPSDSLVNALTLTPSEVNLFNSVLEPTDGSAPPPVTARGPSMTRQPANKPSGTAKGKAVLADQIVDSLDLPGASASERSRDMGASLAVA